MRKRSKYRPKGVILDTMAWVRNGFRPLNDVGSEAVKLRLRNHLAINALEIGEATRADMDVLIAASNMTMALKHNGFGDEYAAIARSGADAIEAVRNRANKWHKFQATEKELEAIKEMMELHDAQLDTVRIADLDAALKLARKKEMTVGV